MRKKGHTEPANTWPSHQAAAVGRESQVKRNDFYPLMHGTRGALLIVVLCGVGGNAALAQSAETFNFGPVRIAGEEPSYLDLGAGAFDIQGHRGSPRTAAEGRVEFRYGKKLFFIGPAIGLLANTQGGILGYGGFYADLKLGQFVVTPLGAVAGYHRGGSEDLGGTFEFRASIAAAYELGDQARIGVQFAHVSNAGTGQPNVNPGPNELLLTYSMPLRLPYRLLWRRRARCRRGDKDGGSSRRS